MGPNSGRRKAHCSGAYRKGEYENLQTYTSGRLLSNVGSAACKNVICVCGLCKNISKLVINLYQRMHYILTKILYKYQSFI
jgi:hypothetical protein